MVGAALLAFAFSFDEVLITKFHQRNIATLPLYTYSRLHRSIDPSSMRWPRCCLSRHGSRWRWPCPSSASSRIDLRPTAKGPAQVNNIPNRVEAGRPVPSSRKSRRHRGDRHIQAIRQGCRPRQCQLAHRSRGILQFAWTEWLRQDHSAYTRGPGGPDEGKILLDGATSRACRLNGARSISCSNVMRFFRI